LAEIVRRNLLRAEVFYECPESPTRHGKDTGEIMKNTQSTNGKKWMGSMALASAVLGGFVLFAGASGIGAADGDDHSRERQRQYRERRDGRERFEYSSRESRDGRYENRGGWRRDDNFRREYREPRGRNGRDYDRDRDRR
jgi:hypothetical protein